MNESEQELVTYLRGIKDQKMGLVTLRTDVPGWAVDFFLDARYDYFASECIFDDCPDEQVRFFLNAYLAGSFSVSWSVSQQFSKLLSKRSDLVSETMDRLLQTVDWSTIENRLLFLSYLALRQDGPALALKLLEVVPDDGRDGLFLACHRLRSEELDRTLIRKFPEWEASQGSLGATGHIYALSQFIPKWLALYPYQDLEAVIRMYFNHRRQK